jgi:hypothetical protein
LRPGPLRKRIRCLAAGEIHPIQSGVARGIGEQKIKRAGRPRESKTLLFRRGKVVRGHDGCRWPHDGGVVAVVAVVARRVLERPRLCGTPFRGCSPALVEAVVVASVPQDVLRFGRRLETDEAVASGEKEREEDEPGRAREALQPPR